MNPMRALMQIPLRGSPKLTEPEKWSKDFSDFLEISLEKDPKKRAKIADLLAHPFLKVKPPNDCFEMPQKPVDNKVLRSLIQQAAKEKARVLAEEYADGVTYEGEDFADEGLPPSEFLGDNV